MGRNLGIEYKMRMTQELKDRLTESAKNNNRSLNADIVARLEQSFGENTSRNVRITDFDGLSEPAMSIELEYVTIGVMKSKYSEITLQHYKDEQWALSYHGLRCMINEHDAKALIERGCTLAR